MLISMSRALESPDKAIIGLRVDQRDATRAPVSICLASGRSRQLAATLLQAADIADDIDDTRTRSQPSA